MTRAQQYIDSVLENVPTDRLGSDEDRASFASIKQKLLDAPDFEAELRTLYQVNGFSHVALQLLWIAQRVENDSSRIDYEQEEVDVVLDEFLRAFSGDAVAEAPPIEEESSSTEASVEHEPILSESSEASHDSSAGDREFEESFSVLLEKFAEAMQGGDDSRSALLHQVIEQCDTIVSGTYPETLQQFATYLKEFLVYLQEKELMDDVRVMNILSNITAPVSQWVALSDDQRHGALDEGVAALMDFKSLFE